ncbi:tyrosine-type recombinase/integrase [Chromobacterium vaccinii]|uniref:tyrosine-type recombinase/integrase n=1 Tax=Chromobacterium vaccinii TaxID=1108595 RepID=UPI00345B32E6
MAGTRRRNRRHWPDYLLARPRQGGLYYYWKHPNTKKEYGLGYDFAEAASQAREANATLAAAQKPAERLTDRIKGNDNETMATWLNIFEENLKRRPGKNGQKRSENTIRSDKSRIKFLREGFDPDKLIRHITPKDCSDVLRPLLDAGKIRMAQAIHRTLVDAFNDAISNGWLELGKNPAQILDAPQPVVKRARLKLDQFIRILNKAKASAEPWMETAMMIAILTSQRVGDISSMMHSDIRLHEGKEYLHVIQDKEGHPIRIPTELGLPQFPNITIATVIKSAKKHGIIGSKYICHHLVSVGFAKPGEPVHEQTISKNFTSLIRETFTEEERNQIWPGKTPPTFHEIRSLSKSLYKAIGVDTLILLGHKSASAAAIYDEKRGEWWTVELPQKITN